MPSASQLAEAVYEYLDRKDPGVEYRAGPGEGRVHYDGENIVGNTPSGSQNWGPILGANALIHFYNQKDWGRVSDILYAWGNYAKLNFLTTETFTCNIYHHWITYPTRIAYNIAVMRNEDDVAEGLWHHMRTNRVLSALSSGWQRNTSGFNGYPCTMCGARSFNRPDKYLITGSTFASAELAGALGLRNKPDIRLRQWSKRSNIHGISGVETDALTRIVRNVMSEGDLDLCIGWLRDGPGFSADARIIRTTNMVGWFNETTINTGSTSYLMAKAWFASGRPRYYGDHPWVRNSHHAWVTVDPTGRSKGAKNAGVISSTGYAAQRITARKLKNGFITMPESWYDELGKKEVPGWRNQLEFSGDLKMDLRVGRRGIELLYPGGDIEPPPPPNGGGWHSIQTTGPAHLKFTDAAAKAALAQIDGGSNHFDVSQVALAPAELAAMQRELSKIVGG